MALAEVLVETGRGVNGGAFFMEGMNSSDDGMFLGDRAYFSAMNVVNRGGLVQTRPGFRCLFTIPDGNLQGMCYFRPLNSSPFLVFAVEGVIYASKYPYVSYTRVQGIQFYKAAPQIFWTTAIKSVSEADDGTLTVIDPIRMLMMQDGGYTKGAYWDGSTGRHLNPAPNPTIPVTAASTKDIPDLGQLAASLDGQPLVDGNRILVKDQVDLTQNGIYTWKDNATGNNGTLTRADDAVTTAQLKAGNSYFVSFGAFNTNTSWEITTAPTVFGTSPIRFTRSTRSSGFSETPLGSHMAWSGDRLWLAYGNRLFASNIDDPTKFTEIIYLSEGGSFFTAEPITALAEIPGLKTPQLMVFTANMSYVIASGIRDRSRWKGTDSFQAVLFPAIGCVSQRSIISQYGLLWWMTSTGLTNYNAAQQAQVTSSLAPVDIQMAVSKGSLSPNISQVAGVSFENYGLFSVPSGSKYNKHTWVMDKASAGGGENNSSATWDSVWTGTFPVEWATGVINGVQRVFHVSRDADGHNRLWEAFSADRRDNGLPITCYIETKTYIDFSKADTGLDLKKFVFAEIGMSEIYGDVAATVYWAGTRGQYKKLAEYNFICNEGALQEGVDVELGQTIYSYRPQSRTFRTPDVSSKAVNASPCSVAGVESKNSDIVDIGFSLVIAWSGRAALRHYRLFADTQQEPGVGGCSIDESKLPVKDKFVVDQMCQNGLDAPE